MIKITTKKLVSGIIATLAISSISLNAADSFGSVNGKKITKQDIAIVLRNPKINFNTLPKKAKNQVLDQVIEKKLLAEKAFKSGVDKDSTYKDALEKLKRDLALEVWMQKEFKKIKVTEKEKKSFYNKNKAQFKIPAILETRHIITKTEAEAKTIIKSLNKSSNKKDEFIKLAKTKSMGPTATEGGYLGEISEVQLPKEFSKAAKTLTKGKYTKSPVKTKAGYNVIYLESKSASQIVNYGKAKGKISQVLLQQKFKAHIKKQADSLRKSAKIVIK